MKNGVSNANVKKKKGFDNDKPNNSFSRASITIFFGSLPCRGSLYDYEVRFPDATLSVTCEYSHPRAS